VLDVGQGDSTLILASDTAPGGLQRSILIDGGDFAYGEVAHDYIANTLGLPSVDHVLLTHYNDDHGGGLQSLLLADDLTSVVEVLTNAAIIQANITNGNTRLEQIGSVTAAVCSAALGNYGPANAATANLAAYAARNSPQLGNTDDKAVNRGIKEAQLIGGPPGVASVIPNKDTRRRVARLAGIGAADAIAHPTAGVTLLEEIRQNIFDTLSPGVIQGARFHTDNIYNATHVIDLGDTADVPAAWPGAISGGFTLSKNNANAPIAARQRTSVPALGREVLWNSGPNAMVAPAQAPRAYVVSRSGSGWGGTGNPSFNIATGHPDNDSSIGLVIRFNNFFYFTAGDMPTYGEDRMMAAIMTNGMPNPAGGAFGLPTRMASLKCGHHGSNTATSAAFLASGNPASAMISCGYNNSYEHPDDPVLQRLQGRAGLSMFYLTNCNFVTPHVPGTQHGVNQLTAAGNKSRVCGDNNNANLTAGRNRGDIHLQVSQAASTTALGGPARQYAVEYWEEDLVPANFNVNWHAF
jgi:hypothetical protein